MKIGLAQGEMMTPGISAGFYLVPFTDQQKAGEVRPLEI